MSMVKTSEKYYPRVLLINYTPISKRLATGITIGNIFRGWPKDRIAQIYCDDSEPDESICNKSWHMEIYHLNMPTWLRKMVKMKYNKLRQSVVPQYNLSSEERINSVGIKDQLIRFAKSCFLSCVQFSSYKVSSELELWVKEFNADIIYATLGNLRMLKLVQDISARSRVPVVPHFMDDWVFSLHSKTLIDKYQKISLLKRTSQIIRDAPVLLVISEAMAEEYHKRYGRVFLPFMNCIDFDIYKKALTNPNTSNVFRFVYVGGLHHGRLEMLFEVAKSIEEFGATLDIYTPIATLNIEKAAIKYPSIKFRGSIAPENTATIYANCDGLIHVESFDESHKAFTRFSISTKLPEYFASGTAVFAYGPNDIASIKYIYENNCGIVSTEQNKALLTSRLKEFIIDEGKRREVADNALRLCAQNHEAGGQREKLREALGRHINSEGNNWE